MTGNKVGEQKERPGIPAFCASVWHEFFPDLPFTASGLKSAVFASNPGKILIILTLLGLLLRLWHIGDISLWLDEAVTNSYAQHSFLGIGYISTIDNNPPVFYWIEHGMLYFGSGETVLRLIPALLGVCTIPVFYLLGKEFYNRETGIIAAALLTFSSYHIYYSQEARPYTLLLFCFSLALLFCFRAIRTNSHGAWLLFGVFSAFSCWSHLFGFVMVFPLFITAFVSRYRSWKTVGMDLRPVLLAGAVCFLISLPMLILTIFSGISKIAAAQLWGVRGTDVITNVLWNELGQSVWVMFLLIFLFLLGLLWLFFHNRRQFFFMVTAIVLPLVITVALSYRMAITDRYLIGLLPFFFIGIAYFIGSFRHRIVTVRLSCIVILVLVAFSLPSLTTYYSADSKNGQDWKSLSSGLPDQTGPGDLILVFPYYEITPLSFYYHNETEHTFVYGSKNTTDLEGFVLQDPDQKKFLIIADSTNTDSSGEIRQWITAHAGLVEQNQELSLYRIYPQH
jgi:mannosyltransferase